MASGSLPNPEQQRLDQHHEQRANWKLWGPYLSDRAWGTVREDSTDTGDAWTALTYEQAAAHPYRWNEDGLGGISDRYQYLCFAWAFWNGNDPLLKERLFGLTSLEGNHGEDVKEAYFYLDNTPTHSYMQMLYKYPQAAFPYEALRQENKKRDRSQPEWEILDSSAFADQKYFDLFIEYAKAATDDLVIRITAHNRFHEAAPLWILPQLWFRNTWSFGYSKGPMGDVTEIPHLELIEADQSIAAHHCQLGTYFLYSDQQPTAWLFTENVSAAPTKPAKDGFHRAIIHKDQGGLSPSSQGTKGAGVWNPTIPAGGSYTLQLRLSARPLTTPFADTPTIWKQRKEEADLFYQQLHNQKLHPGAQSLQRKAFAGLLWSKQLYYLDVEQWLRGDGEKPRPIETKRHLRNFGWEHLKAFDVLSMPDKWEYPYFCAWDMAFHCVPLVMVDSDLAKRQMLLMTREWYLHPNGQLPSYEWSFCDVNPPVHAWGAWRVYKIESKLRGRADREFLQTVFHKLLLNFTWWVNRKDAEDNNIFQGGFLGMDNISLFNRSTQLPVPGRIDQSDGTSWMGFFTIVMMKIALELAKEEPVYQDLATKFFEHFLRIASAMSDCGRRGHHLWDSTDGFFYDVLHLEGHQLQPLRIRSLVGLLSLLAVETIDAELLEQMPVFTRRMQWLLQKQPGLSYSVEKSGPSRYLVALMKKSQLIRVLQYMLDENEFLSPFGIRSLSKYHQDHPFVLKEGDQEYRIGYEPGLAQTSLFGGNSNWRGPVWFPINYLLIEALQKFHHYFGDDLRVECPTGSGQWMTLGEVATFLSQRLMKLFIPTEQGRQPSHGDRGIFDQDPHWKGLPLFHEFYHGDTGEGLGASHQTGWTALIAKLLQQSGEFWA